MTTSRCCLRSSSSRNDVQDRHRGRSLGSRRGKGPRSVHRCFSGYELTRMLDEAGIRRADCFLTNVFNLRPKDNDLENICQKDKRVALDLSKQENIFDLSSFPKSTRLVQRNARIRPKSLPCCLEVLPVGHCLVIQESLKSEEPLRRGRCLAIIKCSRHITRPPSSGTGPSAP
jgi:hypothetical protein